MNQQARLPTYAVRPGVVFPDWPRVRSATARAALGAVLEALDVEKRWGAGYEEALDRVRRAILEHYGCAGRAPSLARLSAVTGKAREGLAGLLRRLQDRDLVVLDGGGAIAGAYPFTERKTGHRVRLDRKVLNAMCAIDALGAGAMLGRDVVVESSCRNCGASIHVETRDHGSALKTYRPEGAVVWSGIENAEGCAATSLCTVMAFFCSDAHLASWRKSEHPGSPGFRLSMDEARQVGTAIFAPMLAPASSDECRPPRKNDRAKDMEHE